MIQVRAINFKIISNTFTIKDPINQRSMKYLLHFLLVSLTAISCKISSREEQLVKYGSNNGKYVSIKGTRIYYEEYGKGIPLLLLHPGLGSIENFKDIIPVLSQHFRCIIPDAPGHGRSEHTDSMSRQLLADVSSALIDSLQLDSVYVFGWSTGGITSLSLAAGRPDKVKRIISGGSNTTLNGITDEGIELMHAYTIEAIEEDKEWLANYQKMNPQPDKWKSFVESTRKMWFEEVSVTEEELKNIEIPVLVIRGDQDLIKLEHSIQLYRSLKKGQLCIYPDAGHNMPSQQTDMLCKIATEFLKKHYYTYF
jgi:pimeloyl-ACP methyl ester carboxylesterase